MSTEPVLPIVQGDWVARIEHTRYAAIGRVRQSYWDREPGGAVCMDVVLYDTAGVDIGRTSPAMGGPKTFEPAVEFGEWWQRIEKPNFPLISKLVGLPSQGHPGKVTLVETLYHATGLKPKPARTKPRKQSRDYPRAKVVVVKSTNGAEIEAAALRRSAQELRDVAKGISDGVMASTLIGRARTLEAEAAALS